MARQSSDAPSPRPWRRVHVRHDGRQIIIAADGKRVGEMRKANAELTIRAVNAYKGGN